MISIFRCRFTCVLRVFVSVRYTTEANKPLKVNRLLKSKQLTTLAKMPKIVPSFEHMLKTKIEALEAELAQLGAENEHLKTENVRLTLLTLGKQPHKTALASKTLTAETPSITPSYLRPTVASINRSVKPIVAEDSKVVDDDRSPMYVDGRLVVLNKPRPHYASNGDWADFSTFGQEEKTRWVTHSRPSSPTPEKIPMRYSCESCNELETSWQDESAHSLVARTRLNDAEHNFQDRLRLASTSLTARSTDCYTQPLPLLRTSYGTTFESTAQIDKSSIALRGPEKSSSAEVSCWA